MGYSLGLTTFRYIYICTYIYTFVFQTRCSSAQFISFHQSCRVAINFKKSSVLLFLFFLICFRAQTSEFLMMLTADVDHPMTEKFCSFFSFLAHRHHSHMRHRFFFFLGVDERRRKREESSDKAMRCCHGPCLLSLALSLLGFRRCCLFTFVSLLLHDSGWLLLVFFFRGCRKRWLDVSSERESSGGTTTAMEFFIINAGSNDKGEGRGTPAGYGGEELGVLNRYLFFF